jgi:hypothetical protein
LLLIAEIINKKLLVFVFLQGVNYSYIATFNSLLKN